MRYGTCTEVINGDTILVDNGYIKIRYSNVWAPERGTPLGDAAAEYNRGLALGKEVQYEPNGHIHLDHESIVAEVYVDGLWVNQEMRYWLATRV